MVRSIGIVASVVLAALLPVAAHSTEHSTTTAIQKIYTYTTYAYAEDIVVQVATPPAGCDGFWLKSTDPGFKNWYALLLSAYHAGQQVHIGGQDVVADRWSGSNGVYCRVSWMGLGQ